MFVARFSPSRCDFRLEAQHIAVFYADITEALVIEQLFTTGAVVEFVAEDLAVGGVLGEVHLLQQHRENAVYGRIIGHIHLLAFVARRIPHMDTYYSHPISSQRPFLVIGVVLRELFLLTGQIDGGEGR